MIDENNDASLGENNTAFLNENTPACLDSPPSASKACQEKIMDNITMDQFISLPVIKEGNIYYMMD